MTWNNHNLVEEEAASSRRELKSDLQQIIFKVNGILYCLGLTTWSNTADSSVAPPGLAWALQTAETLTVNQTGYTEA